MNKRVRVILVTIDRYGPTSRAFLQNMVLPKDAVEFWERLYDEARTRDADVVEAIHEGYIVKDKALGAYRITKKGRAALVMEELMP